jgi:micrococcal nuclease
MVGCGPTSVEPVAPAPLSSVQDNAYDRLLEAHNKLLLERDQLRAENVSLRVQLEAARTGQPTATTSTEASAKNGGKVVGVSDGDTLTLLVGREQLKIRLHGIDAPETGQPYGSNAKQELSDLCFGKEIDYLPVDRDKYGRTVAVVMYNGQNVNLALLRRGAAWHFLEYDTSAEFATAEREAKEAKRGLWADVRAVAPWDWRDMSGPERTAALANRDAPRSIAPAENSLVPSGTSSAKPVAGQNTHWINTKSGVRHNASCRWYGETKNGRACTASEGHACEVCGG